MICLFIVFQVTPEELDWRLEGWIVKSEIGIGINDEPNRSAFALLPGNSRIIFASDHLSTSICSAPIVTLANQDQGRHGHNSLEATAFRIERSSCSKFVFGRGFNRATF